MRGWWGRFVVWRLFRGFFSLGRVVALWRRRRIGLLGRVLGFGEWMVWWWWFLQNDTWDVGVFYLV